MATDSVALEFIQHEEMNTQNSLISPPTSQTLQAEPFLGAAQSTTLHPTRPPFASASASGVTATTSVSAGLNTLNGSTNSLSTAITTPQSVTSPLPPASSPGQHFGATGTGPPPNPPALSNSNSFHRSRSSVWLYWLQPLIAFVIYAVTLGVARSASTRYTLLGRVSATLGTWFLAVLAKGGDLAFAAAIADTFDCLAWGTLRKRWRPHGSPRLKEVKLEWFLALVSSTSIVGLILLIWKQFQTMWKGRGTWTAPGWDALRLARERWRRWRTARWSLARLLFLAVFIPGPGIILLADLEQKEVFFDTHSMRVSGGLANFNPDLATAAGFVMGPDISRLAQMMLRDPSISWPVDTVDPSCKASKNCTSYLLAGPYRTVQPWPFTVEKGGSGAFRLYQAPFYQVDMWNVENEPKLAFNGTTDCELYGGFDAKREFSMSLCMKQYAEDTLVTGWKSCLGGYDNATNKCLLPDSLPGGKYGWSTYLHFYRRSATLVFSRDTFTILEATDLSPPLSQNMSAASLFTAVNAMLYRPNQTANNFQYDRNSQPYALTQIIGGNLYSSLQTRMNGLTLGKDWLRNILTMPVYLFQATVIASGDNLPVGYQDDGSTPLLGLPEENYVRGSYCIISKRTIPGAETVIGYACVAGFLLLFVAIAKLVAFRWPDADTTEYPLLDYDTLTHVVDANGHQIAFRDGFGPFGREYNNKGVVDELVGLGIELQTV